MCRNVSAVMDEMSYTPTLRYRPDNLMVSRVNRKNH